MRLTYYKIRGSKLPKIHSKIFTRSALMKSLFPIPTEGKVRAMFLNSSKEQLRCKSTIPCRRKTVFQMKEADNNLSTNISSALEEHKKKGSNYWTSKQNVSASTIRRDNSILKLRSKTSLENVRNQYDDTLNMVNKVRMFQIAASKVNKHMAARNKTPVFQINNY